MNGSANIATTSADLCVQLLVTALAAPHVIGPINEAQPPTPVFVRSAETPSTQELFDNAMNMQVTRELERIVTQLIAPNIGISREDKDILYANFWDLCE